MSIGLLGFSSQGGAGRVLVNLEEGLKSIGYDARSYFASEQDIRSEPFRNPQLTLAAGIDNYLIKKNGWKSNVSLQRSRISETLPTWLHDKENLIVGWSTGLFGFSPDLFKGQSVIWTLPDFISFTGFCHNNMGCKGFETGCKRCPAAKDIFKTTISKNLDEKIKFFQGIENLTFVGHSDFTIDNFMKSKLGGNFEIVKLPTPIDGKFFSKAKEDRKDNGGKLRLLMVIGDLDDPIKGFERVASTIHNLLLQHSISVTVVGKNRVPQRKKYPHFRFTGPLETVSLINEYDAADALVVPSLFETAGMVIAEAASRGTPSIVRSGSAMIEMIGQGDAGWLFNEDSQLIEIIKSLDEQDIALKSQKSKALSQAHRASKVGKEMSAILI